MIAEGDILAGKYVVEDVLGRGGWGVVHRARHIELGRAFAIKILTASLVENTEILARFRREAELAARLRHDNLVSVIDVGTTEAGDHFLVMEYAPGVTLSSLCVAPMPEDRVLEIGRQLCDGLQHAHDAGVLHRDFKPDNVIVEQLSDGRCVARIADFGVAIVRAQADDIDGARLTTKGVVVGTPRYMAPEQARGIAVDHRSDLFALGLVLYELLAGTTPFDGSGVDVARANVHLPTPPMGVRAPGVRVAPALEALVRQLLSKNPEDRLPSARAVRRVLDDYARDRFLTGAHVPVGRVRAANSSLSPYQHLMDTRPATTEQRPRRSRKPIAIMAAVASAVFAVGLFIAIRPRPPTPAVVAEQLTQMPPPAPPPPLEPPDPAPTSERTQAPPGPVPLVNQAPAKKSAPKPPARSNPPAPPSPPPAPSTPSGPREVANLYMQVGRELRDLTKTNPDRANDLWPRYRWIRINDALTNETKRAEAVKLLQELHAAVFAPP